MGKYLRKAKPPPQVALMDVTQSTFGVRTRAKTLALQRLPKSSSSGLPSPANSASYLQLRSRRLEKPHIIVPLSESRRQKQNPRAKQNARLRGNNLVTAEPRRSASLEGMVNENEERTIETAEATDDLAGKRAESSCDENCQNYLDLGAKEAAYGENDYGFDDRERGTRESPLCSSTRDPDSIRMPGSTSGSTNLTETNSRLLNRPRSPPASHEMDKFFTGAEEEQQRQFIEKYNFDPVKDKPLPGRYEWEKLGP